MNTCPQVCKTAKQSRDWAPVAGAQVWWQQREISVPERATGQSEDQPEGVNEIVGDVKIDFI